MAETGKIDPFDVVALEKSLNDSATRVSTIWVSFLIFSLYLLVAAATVTHRQLFLAEPIKLPVLNIDLPLLGFFFLAPILFVIFHVYVLVQVLLLARTAATYNETIDKAVKAPPSNAAIRQRLANTLFAQIFAGSPREREGWVGLLLKGMAWITLAIAPCLVLVAFQLSFLASHIHLVTWTHRLLIAIELTTAFVLWPLVLDARWGFTWGGLRRWVPSLIVCTIFGFFSSWIATFPGEPHVNFLSGKPRGSIECWDRPRFEKFDRLKLRAVDVVDHEKLDKILKANATQGLRANQGVRTQDFLHRDLNCSDLSSADLRHVSLVGAQLYGADLSWATLEGASLDYANLQGASLDHARLQGASIAYGYLQGASFSAAKLSGLTGANLRQAEDPSPAAINSGAHLQGANLDDANLQGAFLDKADLQGASLRRVQLQGASLQGAQLQGASLEEAQIQGASFKDAMLQGATFNKAAMDYTDLSGAYVWRARGAFCQNAFVKGYRPDAILAIRDKDQRVEATPEEADRFIARWSGSIPSSNAEKQQKDKLDAVNRMRVGLIADPAGNETTAFAQIWISCEGTGRWKTQAAFDQARAQFLQDFACAARDSRNAVLASMIGIAEKRSSEISSRQLARGLLGQDEKECPASRDLDETTRERLRRLLDDTAAAQRVITPALERPK